jgi:hypothetical protein
MPDRENRIKRRAHEIWEREGRPHGRDAEHWRQAEREIDAAASAVATEAAAVPGKAPPRTGGARQPGGTAGKPGKAPAGSAGRSEKPSSTKPTGR